MIQSIHSSRSSSPQYSETKSDAVRQSSSAVNSLEKMSHQQTIDQSTMSPKRLLSEVEQSLVRTINKCLSNWYEPWRRTYLAGGEEFGAIYDLMENLMHYENQIANNQVSLPDDRLNAIAQAVARLIDYGNAILGLDLIIRINDETSSEIEPASLTTVELFQAHIKAQKLRDKLLCNYFKRDKRSLTVSGAENELTVSLSSSTSQNTLQLPSSHSNNQSPTIQRSHRLSIGSNTSINSIAADTNGPSRPRTPQSVSQYNQIELKTPDFSAEPTSSQLEMRHMLATIRSSAFSSSNNSATRKTLLLGVLAKIESLMAMPTSAEKLFNCFELLGALLISIERLPSECRREEVSILTDCLLKPIVRKVYIDNRDNHLEFQHSHWTTYLLSMIRLMTTADFNSYLKQFNSLTDLSTFLKDYLFIVKRIVSTSHKPKSALTSPTSCAALNQFSAMDSINDPLLLSEQSAPVYPDCWIEMTLLVCSTFLTSLISLYQTLRQNFSSNVQMWSSYLDCLVHFMLEETLKSGRSMFKERQKLLASDLRKISAEYVWITWDSLSYEQKQTLVEDLIEPLLRACMTLESRQRAILLPIFHDMMKCDYTSQYITPRGTIAGGSSAQSTNSAMLNHCIDKRTNNCRLMDYMYDEDLNIGQQLHVGATHRQPQRQHIERNESGESLPYLSLQDIHNHASSNSLGDSDDGTVLTKFTHLVVGKLNGLLVDCGLGDELFHEEFCCALSGRLNSKYHNIYNQTSHLDSIDFNQFKCMARHTAELISEFIKITLDSRQANRLSYNHLHLLCLFKLILYFRDKVDRIELYLANLHKLWTLHHQAGRYIEAGFTLLEHAKTLPWSSKPIESHYRIITRSFNLNEPLNDYSSLKIFLYSTIIEYFDQGQLWEAAIPLCRELVDYYQFETFEYTKLAQIHSKLATYFANISQPSPPRSHPEYFRVTFYGCAFPKCLQNVTMIYRGKPYEKLGDFQTMLLNKYPDAKLLQTLAKPDESLISEPEAKYLQINACTPIIDLKSKFKTVQDLTRVETAIIDYFRHNECDKFEFSRRINRPMELRQAQQNSSSSSSSPQARSNDVPVAPGGDNFANMWRERTTLSTNSLPGMLPFFQVYLSETTIVSPIESAIEDLERTNNRLSSMVNRFRADKRQVEDVRLLGQLLLGVVDAAVNGGIAKYEQAFFGTNGGISNSGASAPTTPTVEINSALVGLEAPTCVAAGADDRLMSSQASKGCTDANYSDHNSETKTITSLALPPTPLVRTILIDSSREQQHQVLIDSCQPASNLSTSQQSGADQQRPYSVEQLNKLKRLIAGQVPLLDEAIRLHRDRVADVMRPQHEHLEAQYKKLKHHIMCKYSRYLPAEYSRSSLRSFRSLARSPNRSARSESRLSSGVGGHLGVGSSAQQIHSATQGSMTSPRGGVRVKRMSDAGGCNYSRIDRDQEDKTSDNESNIPYQQLANERRSLPFLTGVTEFDRVLIKETKNRLENQRAQQGANVVDLLDSPPPPPPTQPESQISDRSEYVCVTDLIKAKKFPRQTRETPYARLVSDKSPRSDDDETNGRDDEDDGYYYDDDDTTDTSSTSNGPANANGAAAGGEEEKAGLVSI